MESHDEERVAWDMFKTFNEPLDYKLAIQRLKLNTAFFLTVPGPKMIWQFGEMGYDEELNNDRLAIKPTHWEYLEVSEIQSLYNLYSSLSNLKTKSGLIDDQYFSWSSSQTVKYINVEHPDASIVIIGNFGTTGTSTNAHFTKNGTWYDYFTGESVEVTDYTTQEINLIGSEFKIFTSELIDNYSDVNPNDFILGTDGVITNNINVYPNPVHLILNVMDAKEYTLFHLFDLNGRIVRSGTIQSNQINLANIVEGIYLLEYISNNGRVKKSKVFKY